MASNSSAQYQCSACYYATDVLLHHFCTTFAPEPRQTFVSSTKMHISYAQCLQNRSTLLSVMSNLSSTARAGSWLAIHQRKAKTCFWGWDGSSPRSIPKWYPSCGHDGASEQLASFSCHSEVTLKLVRKIERYRALKVIADSV